MTVAAFLMCGGSEGGRPCSPAVDQCLWCLALSGADTHHAQIGRGTGYILIFFKATRFLNSLLKREDSVFKKMTKNKIKNVLNF